MNIFPTISSNEKGCGTFRKTNVLGTLSVFLVLYKTPQDLEKHVADLKAKPHLLDMLNDSSILL